MPHLDVKYRSDVLQESDLESIADTLLGIVGKHFQENPDYVSLEIVPQHAVVRNRKHVDLELDSSPDPEGLRAEAAKALSDELAETVAAHLTDRGYNNLEVSAWVRIFDAGVYRYHRMGG